MKLRDALFKLSYHAYQVEHGYAERDSFLDWELEPVMGPTLAAEYVSSKVLQGNFIVSAKLIQSLEGGQDCYVDISLPERISEHHFLMTHTGIAMGRGRRLDGGTIIPAIAIEKFANYTLFLAKQNPQAGVDVLRAGLSQARNPSPIALDLAYLLRDSNRYREAIEAFTTALERLPLDQSTYYYYLERARLYEKIGEVEKALQDKSWAETIRSKT